MIGYCKKSLVGSSHKERDIICQDYSDVITLSNGWIVAAIADGLGSAENSDLGSKIAVQSVLSFVKENIPEKWHKESLISLLRMSYHKAFKNIKAFSTLTQNSLYSYDTTLTVLIYNGTDIVYGHVGDGGIITLSRFGDYSVLTTAQKGEAANETYPLSAGADYWEFGTSNEDICAILMMTDGMFNVAVPWPLCNCEQKIYINFIRTLIDVNKNKVHNEEMFEKLQKYLERFLVSPKINAITDDKTVAIIINEAITPELKEDSYYAEPDWEKLRSIHDHKLYDEDDEEKTDIKKTEEDNQEFFSKNISKDNEQGIIEENESGEENEHINESEVSTGSEKDRESTFLQKIKSILNLWSSKDKKTRTEENDKK